MITVNYEQRSSQQIQAAMKQATYMFVGGGEAMSYSTIAFTDNYYRNSVERIVGDLSDTVEQVTTYAWSDHRNWVKLIDGVPQPPEPVTYENQDETLPTANDHVIIAAPVSVGGNSRAPIAFKNVTDSSTGGSYRVPDISEGSWGDLYTPKYYSYSDVATGENISGYAFEPPPLKETERENFVVGPWYWGFGQDNELPVCASATFLNNSFIIVERFNADWGASYAYRQEFVDINFPCTFYGDSFISPRIGKFTTSNFAANGNNPPSQSMVQGRPAYLKFNQPLSFYDNSQIKMYEGPVHYSMAGVNTQVIPNGFIGGLFLNCNINFYGESQINLFFNHTSKKVYFNDETRFSGGMITNAVFNDFSKRPAGVQAQEEQFAPYARGPHITGKAEFNGKSTNEFPLFCAADFRDSSFCTIPFFNNTNFYDDSGYEWLNFWAPNDGNSFDDTFWTQGIILPSFANKTTIFSGRSTNFSSKVLTTAPTRFLGQARMLMKYRFQDANGYLPSNFGGEFVNSSDTRKFVNAGNGINYTSDSTHIDDTHTHFYCSHAHFKSGNRDPLTVNESPIPTHIRAVPPLIYAEFRNYTGDKDWGNPLNWTRIGGQPSSLPDSGTIVRVKSDVEINNGGAAPRCAGLIIEVGKAVKIDFLFINVFMNYGTFSGTVLQVGDLFMMDNSKNIGTIGQASRTIFTENATNYDSALNLDGFIRTGGLLVIPPRPNNLPIGGTLQAPPPVLSSWSNLDYLMFSGDNKPTPEQVFSNYGNHCFGDFLFQTH
jgi:hypothetical protein